MANLKLKRKTAHRWTHRFSDPWFLRGQKFIAVRDLPSDLYGRPMAFNACRRGGVSQIICSPRRQVADGVSDQSILPELRRRVSATVARYRAESRCTDVELRTIEALWLDGLGLRQFARNEQVEAQAITGRINGLANKAPQFYRWWRLKNLNRVVRKRRT